MANTSFWQRSDGFWNRGGWWKAVLVAVVYLAVYLGTSLLVGELLGGRIDRGGVFASVKNVAILLLLPVGTGAVLIVSFAAAIRWLVPLFGRQPVRGRGWMWIAVAVVVYPILLRLIGIDYGGFAPGVVAAALASGAVIGVAEEMLTRGVAVALLRKAGYGELVVAVLSSALFALLHTTNALGSGLTPAIGVLVVYTFFFGVCMYLVLRVTGSLVWPILLHALTDPTLFLANGGIDTAATGPQNAFLVIGGTGNLAVIAFGAVALFLIRGRVAPSDPVGAGSSA